MGKFSLYFLRTPPLGGATTPLGGATPNRATPSLDGAFECTKEYQDIYEYKIKNDNIIAKRPIASTKEKPKIVKVNKEDLNEGLRAVPLIKAANTKPIPQPAPVNPDDANPAPINLADSRITKKKKIKEIISN